MQLQSHPHTSLTLTTNQPVPRPSFKCPQPCRKPGYTAAVHVCHYHQSWVAFARRRNAPAAPLQSEPPAPGDEPAPQVAAVRAATDLHALWSRVEAGEVQLGRQEVFAVSVRILRLLHVLSRQQQAQFREDLVLPHRRAVARKRLQAQGLLPVQQTQVGIDSGVGDTGRASAAVEGPRQPAGNTGDSKAAAAAARGRRARPPPDEALHGGTGPGNSGRGSTTSSGGHIAGAGQGNRSSEGNSGRGSSSSRNDGHTATTGKGNSISGEGSSGRDGYTASMTTDLALALEGARQLSQAAVQAWRPWSHDSTPAEATHIVLAAGLTQPLCTNPQGLPGFWPPSHQHAASTTRYNQQGPTKASEPVLPSVSSIGSTDPIQASVSSRDQGTLSPIPPGPAHASATVSASGDTSVQAIHNLLSDLLPLWAPQLSNWPLDCISKLVLGVGLLGHKPPPEWMQVRVLLGVREALLWIVCACHVILSSLSPCTCHTYPAATASSITMHSGLNESNSVLFERFSCCGPSTAPLKAWGTNCGFAHWLLHVLACTSSHCILINPGRAVP
jgi:hypothetical protein